MEKKNNDVLHQKESDDCRSLLHIRYVKIAETKLNMAHAILIKKGVVIELAIEKLINGTAKVE